MEGRVLHRTTSQADQARHAMMEGFIVLAVHTFVGTVVKAYHRIKPSYNITLQTNIYTKPN
jgi:hypothetical protein